MPGLVSASRQVFKIKFQQQGSSRLKGKHIKYTFPITWRSVQANIKKIDQALKGEENCPMGMAVFSHKRMKTLFWSGSHEGLKMFVPGIDQLMKVFLFKKQTRNSTCFVGAAFTL